MQTIKFMWNGIKVDGRLYRAWYSDILVDYFSPDRATVLPGEQYYTDALIAYRACEARKNHQ